MRIRAHPNRANPFLKGDHHPPPSLGELRSPILPECKILSSQVYLAPLAGWLTSSTMAIPNLTVHHLSTSSSERIPWLCEELSIPYTLKTYPRDPQTKLAPAEYKALHPAGSAPVINDLTTGTTTSSQIPKQGEETCQRSITLAESSACVQYICTKYAPPNSGIFPSPDKEYYPTFLYWFHWSNGSFQAALTRALSLKTSGVDLVSSKMGQITAARLQRCLDMLEEQLRPSSAHSLVSSIASGGDDTRSGKEKREGEGESGEEQWLVGRGLFTATDIMVVFSLTTFRYWYPYSLAGYPHILGYLERIGKREAYQRAMRKADPGLEPALAMAGEPPESLW